MKKMRFVLKLLKLGLKADASFSLDFLFGIVSSILWIGIPIAFFKLLFLKIDTFDGWTYAQILTLIGIYTIIDGLMMGLLIRSMRALENDILSGALDQNLLKPIDTQILYLFKSVSLVQLVNVFFGLAIVVFSVVLQRKIPTLTELLFTFTLVSIFMGCIIYYSIWFIVVISAFWFPSTVSRSELFLSVIGVGKYPSTIFTGLIKVILYFILPLVLIANPAMEILANDSFQMFIKVQVPVSVLAILLCRFLWKKGLKRYESAGR